MTFYSELFTSSDSELCFSMATLSMPKQDYQRGTSRISQKTPSSQVVIRSSTRTWMLFKVGNLVITGIPIRRKLKQTLKQSFFPYVCMLLNYKLMLLNKWYIFKIHVFIYFRNIWSVHENQGFSKRFLIIDLCIKAAAWAHTNYTFHYFEVRHILIVLLNHNLPCRYKYCRCKARYTPSRRRRTSGDESRLRGRITSAASGFKVVLTHQTDARHPTAK